MFLKFLISHKTNILDFKMCQNLFLKCRVSYKVFFNCKVLVLAETLPVFQNIIKLKN